MKKPILAILLLAISFTCTSCGNNNTSEKTSTNNSNSTKNSVETSKKTSENKSKSKNNYVINDQKFANSKGLYETEKYIYYVSSFNVTRYDKITYSSSRITDDSATIVGVTKDGIYYTETSTTSPELYLIKDDSSQPEYLYSLSNDSKFFIDDDYIYSVSRNGSITKSKNNPKKYSDSSEVIYSGHGSATDIKIYQGHIYYLTNSDELIRISLKDGVSESLGTVEGGSTLHTTSYYFCKDKIVFANKSDMLFYMNLDGSNLKQYKDIKVNYFFVMKDNVYITTKDYKYFSINISSIDSYEEIPITENLHMFGKGYSLSDVGIGMGYQNNANIILLDYDGNEIGKM